MAIIRYYNTGGCEYILRDVGNELIDYQIDRYLCGEKVEAIVEIDGHPKPVVKKLCNEHVAKIMAWRIND